MPRKSKEEMEQIYKEYALPVYKFLYTKCRNESLAEELTQETFYRAVKSIDSFDGSCKLFTWLCQIAKHVWQQELDKSRRRKTEELDEQISDKTDIEGSYELYEAKTRLFAAMQQLEPLPRETVYLRITGELSFKEIGDILGKSENWARVTFYRAKQRLAEIMQKEEQ